MQEYLSKIKSKITFSEKRKDFGTNAYMLMYRYYIILFNENLK